MSERVAHIESVLEAIRVAGVTLGPAVDQDDGRALLAYWYDPTGAQPPWALAATALSARLYALCRSRAVVEVLASALPAGLADVVMVWVESAADSPDVVLSPLVAAPAAQPGFRERAASERLMRGPLFDALHCLPIAWSVERKAHRRRIDQLVWEAGARGLVLPVLGRWAWATPGVVRSLVIDPARGHLGRRVIAARALAVLAEGFSEDTSPGLARVIIGVAQSLLQHREPTVWRAAARGLGRFAAGSMSARWAVFQATNSPRLSVRRRNIAAIGSLPPAVGAESWIEERVDQITSETTRRDDPWQLAALAIATPHLARDRPELWQRLCSIALATPTLELGWSLAQGLAILGRHSAGRGWIAEEERVATALYGQLAALPIDQPIDFARRLEAIVCLDRALGKTPSAALAFDQYDALLHASIEGRPELVATPTLPLVAFEAAIAQLDDKAPSTSGRAIAAIRAATRAHAMRLPDLVTSAGPLDSDAQLMLAVASGRLANQTCEFGVRSTMVGVLTDLVAGQSPGTGFGHTSAQALVAVARSQWMRDLEAGTASTDAKEVRSMKREVQRFRKPLEDLFHTCLAPYMQVDPETTVPPVVAAWWALCAGPAAALAPIERTSGQPSKEIDLAAAAKPTPLASLEAALRTRGPAATWGPLALAAMQALGATDTALGDVFARLVNVLQTIEANQNPMPKVAGSLLSALAAVCGAMVAVGRDLDDALGPANAHDGDADEVAPPSWVGGGGPSPQTIATLAAHEQPWDRLAPLLSAIVAPVGRRLAQLATSTDRWEPRPGAMLGPYELVDLLGRGGMGEVWGAKRGRRPVALKIARSDVVGEERARLAAVLRAEAETIEPLAFAKVAVFLDTGVLADTPYLAMSYVRGRTLFDHLIDDDAADTTGAQFPIVKRVVRDICIGLDNLHRHGLVHRDLKPTNVMLRMRGTDADPLVSIGQDPRGDEIDEAVLIDFGIAHAFHKLDARGGTPGYAAPETIAMEPVGPAADIYALGATIFHVLARRSLTGTRDPTAAMIWHLKVEPFTDPDVGAAATKLPSHLADVLEAACRREPEHRITLAKFRAAFD